MRLTLSQRLGELSINTYKQNYMELTKKQQIERIDAAIHKHRALAAWGNVESKERLRELRASKRELLNKC